MISLPTIPNNNSESPLTLRGYSETHSVIVAVLRFEKAFCQQSASETLNCIVTIQKLGKVLIEIDKFNPFISSFQTFKATKFNIPTLVKAN